MSRSHAAIRYAILPRVLALLSGGSYETALPERTHWHSDSLDLTLLRWSAVRATGQPGVLPGAFALASPASYRVLATQLEMLDGGYREAHDSCCASNGILRQMTHEISTNRLDAVDGISLLVHIATFCWRCWRWYLTSRC